MPVFISKCETSSAVTPVTFGRSNLTSLFCSQPKRQKEKKEPLQTNLNIFIIFKSQTVHISYRLYLHIYQVVSGSCEHTVQMNWAVGVSCTWSLCETSDGIFACLSFWNPSENIPKPGFPNLLIVAMTMGDTWFLLNSKYIIMLNVIFTHMLRLCTTVKLAGAT